MTVLEYLVPSSDRRALLATLLSQQGGLTVRQLANRARVAYSSAHREVQKLALTGLVRTDQFGNALVCRWNTDSAEAKALEALLRFNTESVEEGRVLTNLKRWGAPLAREAQSAAELSLEETLGRALLLVRRHPEVARVWPVVLAKNLSQMRLDELAQVARRLGEKRTLGFLLSLTATLLGDSTLHGFASRLHDARSKQPEDFFHLTRGDRARRLAHENTPPVAKNWLFRMNMPMQSFESLFRKFI